MTISNLNNNISVDTNHNLSFTKDITQTTNVDGRIQTLLVCKLSCHIIANTSITYIMQVVNLDVYTANKDIIQEEVDAFKEHARNMALEHNVPLV